MAITNISSRHRDARDRPRLGALGDAIPRVVLAAAFTLWLLWRSGERGWVRSLGLALLLFVILGPVVQPWYLAWGLVVLAASYKGREHFWLLLLSITGPFIGLPGRSPTARGPRALEPAADRPRRRDPRGSPRAAHGPLDAVVVARASDSAPARPRRAPRRRHQAPTTPTRVVSAKQRPSGRKRSFVGHHVLVLDDVQPAPVLAPYLDLGSDQGKAALLVKSDRASVLADDPRDDRVKARPLGRRDQVVQAAARRPRGREPRDGRRPSFRPSWRRPGVRERARRRRNRGFARLEPRSRRGRRQS